MDCHPIVASAHRAYETTALPRLLSVPCAWGAIYGGYAGGEEEKWQADRMRQWFLALPPP